MRNEDSLSKDGQGLKNRGKFPKHRDKQILFAEQRVRSCLPTIVSVESPIFSTKNNLGDCLT